MKFLLIILLLVPLLQADLNIQNDKRAHAIVGLLSYGTCFVVGKIANIEWIDAKSCVAVPLTLGIVKEVSDYRNPLEHTSECYSCYSSSYRTFCCYL